MHTIKDYTLDYKHYGVITVPAGTSLTHKTAMGIDEKYHFVNDFSWIDKDYPAIANILKDDVAYSGINVPVEYVFKGKATGNKALRFPFHQSAGYIYDKNGILCARVFNNVMLPYEVNEMADILIDGLNKRWNEQDIEKLLTYQGLSYPSEYMELAANTYSTSPDKASQLFTAMPIHIKRSFIGYIAERTDLPNSAFTFFINLL